MSRLLLALALIACSGAAHAQPVGAAGEPVAASVPQSAPEGAAVFTDLGFGLAGGFGLVPTLVGEGTPAAGQEVFLTAGKMAKSSFCWLVVGREAVYAPFKGGVMVPQNALGFGPVPTRKGLLFFDVIWPHHIPAGSEFFAQVWVLDGSAVQGLSASNGLMVVSQ
jgi:hypothetical protein